MPQIRICFFQKHHLIVSTARYIPIFSAIKTAYEALNTQWIFQSGILKASTMLARNHTVSECHHSATQICGTDICPSLLSSAGKKTLIPKHTSRSRGNMVKVCSLVSSPCLTQSAFYTT